MTVKTPKFIQKFRNFLDEIHIPGLGISLLQLFKIYGEGVFKEKIGRKAAAISWNFVFSLFPFILFILSILPYLPHYSELRYYVFEVLLHNVFPDSIEGELKTYINDNILPTASGSNSYTIILALIFATNGTFAIIDGFNEKSKEKLSDVKEFIVAFFITIGFITIGLLALFGLYYSEVILKYFTPSYNVSWVGKNLSSIIGYVSFPLFYFLLLTLFYWAGTVKIEKFKQAIPGAILTTFLFVLTTYLFTIYVGSFARYNVLYGSIGTMILLMVWINVNVYLLLFGNELNFAIRDLRKEKILVDQIKQNIQQNLSKEEVDSL